MVYGKSLVKVWVVENCVLTRNEKTKCMSGNRTDLAIGWWERG